MHLSAMRYLNNILYKYWNVITLLHMHTIYFPSVTPALVLTPTSTHLHTQPNYTHKCACTYSIPLIHIHAMCANQVLDSFNISKRAGKVQG